MCKKLIVLSLVLLLAVTLGCKDKPKPPEIPLPANYHTPKQWNDLVRIAGFEKFALIGDAVIASKKVILVSPPTLDDRFNAITWIVEREIWINRSLFARYPTIQEQSAIWVHELVHLDSQEASHNGPWWSVVNEYEHYWQTHPLPGQPPPAEAGSLSTTSSKPQSGDHRGDLGRPDPAKGFNTSNPSGSVRLVMTPWGALPAPSSVV